MVCIILKNLIIKLFVHILEMPSSKENLKYFVLLTSKLDKIHSV